MGTLYNGGSAVYNIPDLDAGILYYVRVSAVSEVGTSDSTLAANNPVAPSQHPNAPAAMAAEAVIASDAVINSEIEVGLEKKCAASFRGKEHKRGRSSRYCRGHGYFI